MTTDTDDRRLSTGGHADDLVECDHCDRRTTRLGAFTRGWRLRNASGGIERRCPDCL